MKRAVNNGSKAAQLFTFGALSTYFLKGNSVGLKMVAGFFFMYWFNHTMTLGSYAGAFVCIPCTTTLIKPSTSKYRSIMIIIRNS